MTLKEFRDMFVTAVMVGVVLVIVIEIPPFCYFYDWLCAMGAEKLWVAFKGGFIAVCCSLTVLHVRKKKTKGENKEE